MEIVYLVGVRHLVSAYGQCGGAQCVPTHDQPISESWGTLCTPFIDLSGVHMCRLPVHGPWSITKANANGSQGGSYLHELFCNELHNGL